MNDLSREMLRYERNDAAGAMMFIDLDNFKPINDRYGHEKGDDALRSIANILSSSTRPYDLIYRFGGDEFAVWLKGANKEIALVRGKEFLSQLREWTGQNVDTEIGFGMSIGIAMFAAKTAESLIVRADAAMYDAKNQGKNRLVFAQHRPQSA